MSLHLYNYHLPGYNLSSLFDENNDYYLTAFNIFDDQTYQLARDFAYYVYRNEKDNDGLIIKLEQFKNKKQFQNKKCASCGESYEDLYLTIITCTFRVRDFRSFGDVCEMVCKTCLYENAESNIHPQSSGYAPDRTFVKKIDVYLLSIK